MLSLKNTIFEELNEIQNKQEVTETEVKTFGERVKFLFFGLNKQLDDFNRNVFVPLPNIENLNDLKLAIIEGGSFENITGPIFDNGGFDQIIGQLDNVIAHCQRLDQKSIGVILAYHKQLE